MVVQILLSFVVCILSLVTHLGVSILIFVANLAVCMQSLFLHIYLLQQLSIYADMHLAFVSYKPPELQLGYVPHCLQELKGESKGHPGLRRREMRQRIGLHVKSL